MCAGCDSHGANLDLRSVLVSFFSHVHHAKVTIREEDAGFQLGGNGVGGQAQMSGYLPNSELDDQNELTSDKLDWPQRQDPQII
ncbi:hypothetical protein PITC_083550 [Penicillium italicum]|uniref:Uncharacterized protein n=1 Tax=Penicillium italicum TaxID=40296 RepID=A0A0A2L6F5_PENIT|nr:hypothetical protein PITC_083550 [Penicillium italicum]